MRKDEDGEIVRRSILGDSGSFEYSKERKKVLKRKNELESMRQHSVASSMKKKNRYHNLNARFKLNSDPLSSIGVTREGSSINLVPKKLTLKE